MRTATLQPQFGNIRLSAHQAYPRNSLILLGCERGDLNPHALRHRILSPARLPFRHSRVRLKLLKSKGFLKRASIIPLPRAR
jgi:hypothetical protein